MEKGDRMFLGEVHTTEGRRIQYIHNAVEVEITIPSEGNHHLISSKVCFIGAKGTKVGKAVKKNNKYLYKTKEEALEGVQKQIDKLEEGFNLEIKKARDNTK